MEALLLNAPAQSQMQSSDGACVRIAIVGAGVAGPALAALLGRLDRPPQVEIFERGSRDMDQGGGYDLNNQSRRVLEKAGVMHRYWEMTRPDSNFMSTWIHGQTRPFVQVTQPRWAHSCCGPKYETNRSKLREVLIDAAEKHVKVTFDCAVEGLRQVGNKAELRGKNGAVLGVYDLVIDASGVGSPLRRYRIQQSAEDTDPENADRQAAFNKAYTGVSMVHGVILDPEVSCDRRFVEKLGEGTVSVIGPRGKFLAAQRYGADPADHRASFYYWQRCPKGPGQLHEILGLPTGSSQWHRGETLQKIRDHVRADMGDGWDPVYSSVVDAIDFAAIRPILLHDRAPTFRENELPLICIGDSLHVVPPWTGKGGNLAMVDALDVGMWLVGLLGKSEPISIEGLRRIETQCMTRSAKETDDAHEFPEKMDKLTAALKDTQDVSFCTCSNFADIFCDDCCKRLCFKGAVCCCRPMCNCCGCLRC